MLRVMEKFSFYQYKMTQYNSLNVRLPNSQLNKVCNKERNRISFKTIIKNGW